MAASLLSSPAPLCCARSKTPSLSLKSQRNPGHAALVLGSGTSAPLSNSLYHNCLTSSVPRNSTSQLVSNSRTGPVVLAEARSKAAKGSSTRTPGTGAYLGKLGSDNATTRAAAGAESVPLRHRPVPAGALFFTLAVAIGLPLLGGVLVSMFASPLQEWYQDLEKPSWEPPDWLFGAVWSLLYTFMGLASWLVYADGGLAKHADPLRLYAVQLFVNYLWPIVFFKMHQLRLGVAVLGVLVLLVNATMRSFYSINRLAGWLMLPYLAWSVFALVLNWDIWRRNRDSGGSLSGATWSAAPRPGDDSW